MDDIGQPAQLDQQGKDAYQRGNYREAARLFAAAGRGYAAAWGMT